MREGRKLTAILAADIVGYSRMMGQDEAGTARVVRERREAAAPIVRSFGGRVVKTMGDGVLLEFPSIVAAVECAIAIQKEMAARNAETTEDKRIVYRVGVHLGDVLIDGDDILGDGVNVAARLEGIAEPGGVCISGSAYDHVRGRVVADFADFGERQLKNIATPIRAYFLSAAAVGVAPTPSLEDAPTRRPALDIGRVAIAAAVALRLVAAGWLGWRALTPGASTISTAADKPGSAPRLSLVVLPFENLSGDAAQNYFADAITDDLTTYVSQIPNSFVIAHNTASTFKDKAVDVGAIARELNVRYAVEGSVRRNGDQVRVNVQLIEAKSGAHVWADRFEYPVTDLGALQDQITARLANELGVELVNVEAARSPVGRDKSVDAVDLRLKGWATLNRGYTRDNIQEAIRFFDQALAIDPDDRGALVGLGFAIGFAVYFQWNQLPRAQELERGLKAVDRALAAAPNDALAHMVKGVLLTDAARHEEALPEYDAAIAINPNLSAAYGFRGMTRFFAGRPEETFSDVERAMALSPHDPVLSGWYRIGCAAHVILAQADAGIEWCRKSAAIEKNWITYANLAAAYGLAGRLDDAKAALDELRILRPEFISLKGSMDRQRLITTSPRYLSLYEQNYLEGLRKGGVPER
jgi:adenylate cyclase